MFIDQLDYCTPHIRNRGANNVPFVEYSKLSYESVGIGLLKDFSLMGTFPLSSPNPPQQVATINNISTLSQWSPSSDDPGLMPSPSKISSSLHVSQDPIPPPSSLSDEHLTTHTNKLQRNKRKGGRHKKWKTTKKSPTSGHHTGHPPLSSTDHVGGKVPTYGHHVGINWLMVIMLGHKWYTNISSTVYFSISSLLKNEAD